MKTKKRYDLYRLEKGHLQDLQSIIYQSFGKRMSIDLLRNKYDCSAFGVKPVATIAYDGRKPIAFYGAIPQCFDDNGQQHLIAHTCDSYTIPAYQRQGLHYQLATKSYELMRAQGFRMAYAYHSENTYYSTKKLMWEEHLEMKRFHLFTRTLPFAKATNKCKVNALLKPWIDQVLNPFEVSQTENPFKRTGRISQVYNHTFYDYKEGIYNHYKIELEGCHFYLKVKAIMHIGFIDFPDKDSLRLAIKKLGRLAQKMGINEVMFQVDPSSRAYMALTQILPAQPSWLIGYLWLDQPLDIMKFGFNYADLDTF